MNKNVENALEASLSKFEKIANLEASKLKVDLKNVFNLDANFMEKVSAFDAVFDNNPKFEELREVYFDLLMVNFFSEDAIKLEENYLESDEWAKIEDETIDRGTEMLNLLLYINDCHDEKIKPSLEDFLKEFLLVEEDEFQDEFHIYESLISNQLLSESGIEDICSNAKMIDINEEMEELFVPFMAFFHQPTISAQVEAELQEYSNNPALDVAVYSLLTHFNKV